MKKDGVCQQKRRLEKICVSIFLVVGGGDLGILSSVDFFRELGKSWRS